MAEDPTILICAGAAKAGTTWLYNHLAAHPDCHMRAIKELHYFDTLENGTFRRQIKMQRAFADDLSIRALGGEGAAADRAAQKRIDVVDWLSVLTQRTENIVDYLAYLTKGRGDRRVVADITPSYSLLSESRLGQIATMAPDVRFLYLLRDPVARLWSHVRMLAVRTSASADAVPDAAFALLDRILDGSASDATDRGDYIGALTRMRAAIDPQRLLVMFHEDLLSVPGLDRLCRFLGIRSQDADFSARVHAGPVLAMSELQRLRAQVMLRPQYDFVARHYPDLPENWRRNMGEDAL